MATEVEYFVGLTCERATLRRLAASEVLKLPPREKERLAELEAELRELARRMGFSVRRQVNIRLRELGYPEVERNKSP